MREEIKERENNDLIHLITEGIIYQPISEGTAGGKRARLYGCTAGERPGCGRQREGRRREIKEGKGWSEKQGDNR